MRLLGFQICTEVSNMRVIGLGHFLFAAGLAGLGMLSILSGDFAYTWQPVPPWVPHREALAHASGILLALGGIGMLFRRTAATLALVMTAYLMTWVLFLQGPHVIQAPLNVGAWLGFCENLVLMCGGWILFASLAEPGAKPFMRILTADAGMRVATVLFGLSCVVLGLSHFVYTAATAGMVPAWFPVRTGFAYLTGAGHLAAGVGILLAILPRLAAMLEAIMISIFVLTIHIPGAASAPASRMQWTMLFVASALAGAAWAVARSLRTCPWGSTPAAPIGKP
jgi:uncharacterized membrane protein